MTGTRTQEQQILALLERNMGLQWKKLDPVWSMSRNVAMFGDGAAVIMDTVERLQHYTEQTGVKTFMLVPETLANIESDWATCSSSRHTGDGSETTTSTAELSPVSSADDMAAASHCISTLRTVMFFVDDSSARAGERSYRMTLRFNLDDPADTWSASTFFVVCYVAHDAASCTKACKYIERLAQWRSTVLNKTTNEFARRCIQSDGRAVGIVINTTPNSAMREDDGVRAVAQRYSFTYIETIPDSPTSVNHLCNRLLIAALRSVDAEWAPPTAPYVPRANSIHDLSNDTCINGTHQDDDDRDDGCMLWPFGWPSFLCRASTRTNETVVILSPEDRIDDLRLSISDFEQTNGT